MSQTLIDAIKQAQQEQNWQKVIEFCAELHQQNPNQWEAFWWAGQAHKSLYQYEQAQAAFQTLIERFPHLHQGHEGMVNLLEHQHEWHAVAEQAQAFRQQFPNLWQSYYWQGTAYRELGLYDEAIAVFQAMLQQFPNNLASINGLIWVGNDHANWQMAEQFSDMGIAHFPHYLPFYFNKGRALIHQKRFDEAEAYFLSLVEQCPDSPMSLYGLTRVYATLRQTHKVVAILEQSFQKFPENQGVIRDLIEAYIAHNEPHSAWTLYENHLLNHNLPNHQLLRAKIQQMIHGNRHYLDDMERLYHQYPHEFHIATQYANALMTHTLPNSSACSPNTALQIWLDWFERSPKNELFKSSLINACIKMGYHQQAQILIETLPENRSSMPNLLLRAWHAHQQGDIIQERQYWAEIIQKGVHAEMRLEKGEELTLVSQREIQIEPDDFVLFALARNERLRLPDFIDYYRKLGVTRFIFVDNNSDDGSLAFLLAQDDCHVFSSSSSFNESGSGIAWINYLMHKYLLPNQWCIHTDIDELLVYPHCETHKLPQLTAYLDSQNAEAMSSFMLDMYPENVAAQRAFQSGESMLAKSPYFYNHYHFYHQIQCPYIYPVGGIFSYFHITPFALVKTGVFKFRKDFYFLSATHQSTPMKMADISSTYLHFKMLGDFQLKAHEEVARKQHAGGGVTYRRYAQIYEQNTEEMDWSKLDKSVRYENSQQLVNLGLIQTSDAWERFVAQSQF